MGKIRYRQVLSLGRDPGGEVGKKRLGSQLQAYPLESAPDLAKDEWSFSFSTSDGERISSRDNSVPGLCAEGEAPEPRQSQLPSQSNV